MAKGAEGDVGVVEVVLPAVFTFLDLAVGEAERIMGDDVSGEGCECVGDTEDSLGFGAALKSMAENANFVLDQALLLQDSPSGEADHAKLGIS